MKRWSILGSLLIAAVAYMLLTQRSGGQALSVVYGANGLQQLSYRGVTLEDTGRYPADAFHIWHLKMTDLQGKPAQGAQYGWGENNAGRTWDAVAHRWTYSFIWGSMQVQYVADGDRLNLVVTEQNLPGSGVVLNGAVLYPLTLHFPQLPAGFNDSSYPQLSYTTTGPGVKTADYGSGEAVAVTPDATRPLYSGYWPTGEANSYTAMVASTTPDGLASFQPHFDRPVQPGETDTFTVSLRFAPSGTSAIGIAADAFAAFAETFPSQLNWTDRRPIGTVYLASAPQSGAASQPGGFPNNPRRYFNDSNAGDFDVTSASGLQAFQKRVLEQARTNVVNLRALGAQGAVTWDIEGEQYPHATTYVCSPDQIAQVAPEMEAVITDASSPYRGMKLDDAYFKTMTDAGFRVGVCVRPQHFSIAADGSATQTVLNASADVRAELARKIAFAHDRWGARLFYVDSSVDANGGALDPGIFQQLQASFPDSLLMPEEFTPRYYAYSAPFLSFLFHGDTGTDSNARATYPQAFSNILINDVNASTLAAALAPLTASVKAGDVLMGHVDYTDPNNTVIATLEKSAGNPGDPAPAPTPTPIPVPTPTPTPAPPVTGVSPSVALVSPSAGATLTGTATITANVGVNLDAAGSYLMVDGKEFGTQRVTGPPYLYTLDTTSLSNGAHVLQLWAHDVTNTTSLSSTVAITVANTTAPITDPAPPVAPPATASGGGIAITFPATGQAISGTVQVSALIGQQLDAAGSYLMVDGVQFGYARSYAPPFLFSLDSTKLASGLHTIQVWAHTTGNMTLISDPVAVTIHN